jgi:PIN domain
MAMRDPEDWPTVALALTRSLPIWSQDKDMEAAGITVFASATSLTQCAGGLGLWQPRIAAAPAAVPRNRGPSFGAHRRECPQEQLGLELVEAERRQIRLLFRCHLC